MYLWDAHAQTLTGRQTQVEELHVHVRVHAKLSIIHNIVYTIQPQNTATQ